MSHQYKGLICIPNSGEGKVLLTAILSSILEYIVGFILLYAYKREGSKVALFFGTSVLLYAVAHTIGGTLLSTIKSQYNYDVTKFVNDPNYKAFESLRNFLVGAFMGLALLGISELLQVTGQSSRAKWVRLYAVAGLIAFLALRLYCVWGVSNVKHPFFSLAQWVYLIPGSLIIAIVGLTLYKMGGTQGTLLIALSFLIYAVILPLYAAWKGTQLLNVWYGLRMISDLLLLLGVLRL
ncbi:hypothetical protein [Ignicoccus islandicus]|nr:hypothetical protein [Ignicoccus islandicus]